MGQEEKVLVEPGERCERATQQQLWHRQAQSLPESQYGGIDEQDRRNTSTSFFLPFDLLTIPPIDQTRLDSEVKRGWLMQFVETNL